MSSQYEMESVGKDKLSIKINADSFKDPLHTRSIYDVINNEYESRIANVHSHITKAKSQLPPYWDDKKNSPSKMPMYQHNVASGRFSQSITQVSLPYNSFFPNHAYSRSLLEVKILNYPALQQEEDQATDSFDKQVHIEQAFDNLIKHSDWAIKEHLKLVSDLMLYGIGVYYFEDPKSSYQYSKLDIRKIKFPTGTSTEVDDWEYLFIEHEMTVNSIISKYKSVENKDQNDDTSGWKKDALAEVLTSIYNSKESLSATHSVGDNKINVLDNIRAGGNNGGMLMSSPVSIPVTTCFWKGINGKINSGTFIPSTLNSYTSLYIYQKDDIADKYSDIFSLFVADSTESEVRLVRGWGHKIYNLCHAYDRAFCKFLDHIDYSASLFINMDPADMHKKILNFGSLNIGKFDSIQNVPSVLRGLIEALIFIDSKVDSVTFTNGLNKTELMGGDSPNAELANIMLTVEGRVHKHLLSRFLEQYSCHWRKVLSKILAIVNNKAYSKNSPEIGVKFTEYLKSKNFTDNDLKLDDTSYTNYNLPSSWSVVCRKPDGSGITGTVPHVIKALQPYITSLPEAGYKYLLGRIIADAFGDQEILDKILPGNELDKISSEADASNVQQLIALLTLPRSDFDRDFELTEEVNPELSDASKFITIPAYRESDKFIILNALLSKVDAAQESLAKREIGRTTLHIWLYNLVSTAKNNVEMLQSDQIRGNRPEANALYEKFGQAFNLLRQVESQANADRAKKIDALQKKASEQAQDDPKRIEATAKLEVARARQAEVQLKYDTNNFKKALDTQQNRRAEENHVVDQRLKIKALLSPTDTVSQGGAGRPSNNDQSRGMTNG